MFRSWQINFKAVPTGTGSRRCLAKCSPCECPTWTFDEFQRCTPVPKRITENNCAQKSQTLTDRTCSPRTSHVRKPAPPPPPPTPRLLKPSASSSCHCGSPEDFEVSDLSTHMRTVQTALGRGQGGQNPPTPKEAGHETGLTSLRGVCCQMLELMKGRELKEEKAAEFVSAEGI